MKACLSCKLVLPAKSFHRSSVNRDGRKNVCTICHIDERRRWHVENKPRARMTNKLWWKRHPQKLALKKRRYKRRWYLRVKGLNPLA